MSSAMPAALATVMVAALVAFVLLIGFVLTGELLGGPVVAVAAPRWTRHAAGLGSVDRWIKRRTPAVAPAPVQAAASPGIRTAVAGTTVEALSGELRSAGAAGRRVTMVGTVRNIG